MVGNISIIVEIINDFNEKKKTELKEGRNKEENKPTYSALPAVGTRPQFSVLTCVCGQGWCVGGWVYCVPLKAGYFSSGAAAVCASCLYVTDLKLELLAGLRGFLG